MRREKLQVQMSERALKEHPPAIKKITEEYYTLDEMFNFDKRSLYIKRMPTRTYTWKAEKHAPEI